jgi:hypothetical protein
MDAKMILTREERKRKNSARGRRGAEVRWANYHANTPEPVYPTDLPEDCLRITVDNLITGKTHVLLFHPGSRRGRYKIDVDGTFWTECGFSEVMAKIRKSCKLSPLYIYD